MALTYALTSTVSKKSLMITIAYKRGYLQMGKLCLDPPARLTGGQDRDGIPS